MKAVFFFSAFLVTGMPHSVFAQNATAAEAALDRAAEDERYRKLSAQIVNIQETQGLLLKRWQELDTRLSRLSQEIDSLRKGSGRESATFVTREELKGYVETMKEIDNKREADKALFLKNLRDMEKLLLVPSNPSPSRPSSSGNEIYFEYTVLSGDNLGSIVRAYNDDFKIQGLQSIDIGQVEAINPGLDPDRINVGQIIKIPSPDKR